MKSNIRRSDKGYKKVAGFLPKNYLYLLLALVAFFTIIGFMVLSIKSPRFIDQFLVDSGSDLPYIKPGFPVKALAKANLSGATRYVTVADIDLDQKKEIIMTGNSSGPLYAWRSDGSPASGSWPVSINNDAYTNQSVGNLIGDVSSPLEIAAIAQRGLFSISPTGSVAKLSTVDYLDNLVPPVLVDIDNDGIDEILVHNEFDISCMKQSGANCQGWPQKVPYSLSTLAVSDINNDTKNEIIVLSGRTQLYKEGLPVDLWSQKLSIYDSTGKVLQGFPITMAELTNNAVSKVPVMGDVDGDGYKEIILLQEYGSSLNSEILVIGLYGQEKRRIPLNDFAYGSPHSVVLADLTGDKLPEMIVQLDNSITVRKGDGSLLWGRAVDGARRGSLPVVGDLDGDMSPELATTTSVDYNDVQVVVFDSCGHLLPSMPITLPTGSLAVPAIDDIDNDGRNDLVVGIQAKLMTSTPEMLDKVYAFDIGSGNSYTSVEWGQFGGSAKHQHSYQPTGIQSVKSCQAPGTDTTVPDVKIVHPSAALNAQSTIAITAIAFDDNGVQKVEFYVNDKLIATDQSSPYQTNWKVPSGKENTPFTMTAKAYDQSGNVGTNTVTRYRAKRVAN